MFNIFKVTSDNSNFKELGTAKSETKTLSNETVFGRGVTSIASAKNELFKSLTPFNPLDFIDKNRLFFGINHLNNEPIYLENEDVTHSLIVGPTRSGKGILEAGKIIESIRNGRGVVVIDPKQDYFLIQIIKEELAKQNRLDNLLLANWPLDFGYSGFEDTDTPKEFANKVVAMLDLGDVENNPGATYYRRNERIFLQKVIIFFFKSEKMLGIRFEKNWKSLINFCKFLYKDLENEILYFKEIQKHRSNAELLDRFAKRFFDPKLFSKLELSEQDLDAAKGLYQTLKEFEDINIYSKYSVKDALFSGKILYIKSDMLDAAALKFLKLLTNDIVMQARKFKNAKCDVFADEFSFYPTQTLSAALATIAGFGVKFTIMYQDDGQLVNENLKSAIKSNCQLKIYYKTSIIETLDYIEKLSGVELVTKVARQGQETTIKQEQESLLNITRLRALPRQFVGVLISESLNEPLIFQTFFIKTHEKFNWEEENLKVTEVLSTSLNKKYSIFEVENEDEDILIDVKILSDDEVFEEDF